MQGAASAIFRPYPAAKVQVSVQAIDTVGEGWQAPAVPREARL